MNTRVCTKCGQEKPLEAFAVDRRKNCGLKSWCKICSAERLSVWRDANSERWRELKRKSYYKNHEKSKALQRKNHLMVAYGLTPDALNVLLERSGGCCGICGKKLIVGGKAGNSLHVDHDHDTDFVRGVLCSTCNVALGRFGDSIEGLRKAIFYLEQAARRFEIEQEVKRQLEVIADQSFREDCDA